MRPRIAGVLIGVVFGVTLCWSGMADPAVIRQALLFESAYLYLMFASGVLVAAGGLALLRRRCERAVLTDAPLTVPRQQPARRHVLGSVLFGVGWAAAGACPGPIAAQIGQGVPWALFTLAGVVAGVFVFLRRSVETEPPSDPVAREPIVAAALT
jgi:uncharacterized membrane protein YedE/YeeE